MLKSKDVLQRCHNRDDLVSRDFGEGQTSHRDFCHSRIIGFQRFGQVSGQVSGPVVRGDGKDLRKVRHAFRGKCEAENGSGPAMNDPLMKMAEACLLVLYIARHFFRTPLVAIN